MSEGLGCTRGGVAQEKRKNTNCMLRGARHAEAALTSGRKQGRESVDANTARKAAPICERIARLLRKRKPCDVAGASRRTGQT